MSAPVDARRDERLRVGFLGPPGTFGEEAVLSQPDLAAGDLRPMPSMVDVLAATQSGELDLGLVAIENSIEGTVRLVLDSLVFDYDLRVQREVVLPIRQNLLAPAGTTVADVRRVVSFPDAIAQCRGFLARELPGVEVAAAPSTAEAARMVAEERPPATAAVGTALAGELYGLEVIAANIEDHHDNRTRFVAVARDRIPAPTGNDKTSIVCFQVTDRPGSLYAILGEFAARDINLTRLESRPTKHSLGDYCFIIDLEGHVEDEVVADCLRALDDKLASVKFLGSYPAAAATGSAGAELRQQPQ